MQVVSEEVSTASSAMSIINPKEGALGPFLIGSVWRFQDVKDYRDTVFVVSPDDALVRVRCIGCYHTVAFD